MSGQSSAVSARKLTKTAVCNTCTIQLVRLAYGRAPWFRVVREPLRLGMRALAAWHRVDPADINVHADRCYGCLRFYKIALKEQSATFRWLNARLNPVFDALLESIISPAQLAEAREYARAATIGGDVSADSETKE